MQGIDCITDPPIFRAIHWKGVEDKTMYIFIGPSKRSDEQEAVIQKLERGDDLTRSEMILATYFVGGHADQVTSFKCVRHYLYADDPHYIVRWKLFSHIQDVRKSVVDPNHIYAWYEERVTENSIDLIIDKCFYGNHTLITAEAICHLMAILFNKVSVHKADEEFMDPDGVREFIRSKRYTKLQLPLELEYYDIKMTYAPIRANPYKELAIDMAFVNAEGNYTPSYQVMNKSHQILGGKSVIHFTTSVNVFDELNTRLSHESVDMRMNGYIRKYFPKVENVSEVTKYSGIDKTTLKYIDTLSGTDEIIGSVATSECLEASIDRIHRVHLSIKASAMAKRIDVQTAFNQMQTADTIPFVELRDLNNTYYKIHKESMYERRTVDDILVPFESLKQWTNMDKHVADPLLIGRIQRKMRSLRIKLHFMKRNLEDIFFSMVLYDNGVYDVKVNALTHVVIKPEQLVAAFRNVNKVLDDVEDILALQKGTYYRLSDDVLSSSPPFFVDFVDFEMSHMVQLQSIANVNDIRTWAQSMYPIVDLIDSSKDGSIVNMKYKRVDNFLSMDAIDEYINKNFQLSKDELVEKLQKIFMLKEDDAEKAYQEKMDKLKLNIVKKALSQFHKPRYNNGILIQIHVLNQVQAKVVLKGVRNMAILGNVLRFIKMACETKSHKGKLTKADKQNLDKIIELEKEDKDVFMKSNSSSEADENDDIIGDDDAFNVDDDLYDFGDDDEPMAVDAAAEVSHVPVSIAKGIKEKDDGDDDANETIEEFDLNLLNEVETNPKIKRKYLKLIMNKLLEKDYDLFNYKSKVDDGKGGKTQEFKNYSTLCQTNDRRQPVVLTATEKANIDANYPGSYSEALPAGSTDDMKEKFQYICPKIWCPISNVSLTDKDLERFNNRCPPPHSEPPIFMQSKHWMSDEKVDGKMVKMESSIANRHPGFLKEEKHPRGFSVPCCFKTKNRLAKGKEELPKTGKKAKAVTDETVAVEGEEKTVAVPNVVVPADVNHGNERYVHKLQGVVMEEGRYGVLPENLALYFGSSKCYGLVKEDPVCYVRKGVSQANSLFACFVHVLNNTAVRTTDQFIRLIRDEMSPVEYITMHGGNTLKTFYNENMSIFDKDNFSNFKGWFLSKRDAQVEYVKRFRLQGVQKALADMSGKPDAAELTDDIQREFMIYNSMTHYMMYLASNVPKHHEECLDLVNPRMEWLNPLGINIIIIETTGEDSVVMQCPKYYGSRQYIDLTRPFAFIIKQGAQYEPIASIVLRAGSVREVTTFSYVGNAMVKKLVNMYSKGCQSDYDVAWKNAKILRNFIVSKGMTINDYVINMSLKMCGMVIDKDTYIPLESPCPIGDMGDGLVSFRYIYQLISLRPKMSLPVLRTLFDDIATYTKREFYRVREEIRDGNEVIALTLHNYALVPVHMTRKHMSHMHADILDANIFIHGVVPSEGNGDIAHMIDYNLELEHVVRHILTNREYLTKINFIKHPLNPIPTFTRQTQLASLVTASMKDAQKHKWAIKHIVDDLFQKDLRYILYRLQRGVKLAVGEEILLDQFDISQRKLLLIMSQLQNPYKQVFNGIEDHVQYVSMTETENLALKTLPSIATYPTRQLLPVSTMQMLLPDYFAQDVPMSAYNNEYFDNIFMYIAKLRRSKVKRSMISDFLRQEMERDYERDLSNDSNRLHEEMSNNGFLKKRLTKVKVTDLEAILKFVRMPGYTYSAYELKRLAMLFNVNVVIIGRSSGKLHAGIRRYEAESKHYLIFHVEYTDTQDIYRLVVKNEGGQEEFVFSVEELPKAFYEFMEDKCKKVYKVPL